LEVIIHNRTNTARKTQRIRNPPKAPKNMGTVHPGIHTATNSGKARCEPKNNLTGLSGAKNGIKRMDEYFAGRRNTITP
jgi:hypothetical protein